MYKSLISKYLLFFLILSAFKVSAHTNVILVMYDDLRYNDFSITGAPAFLQTPFVDKIAQEGVMFDKSYAVLSLCAPSRATMLTGTYPSVHRKTSNTSKWDIDSMSLLPYFVQQQGYQTAYIGKYHFVTKPQPNYNDWVATPTGGKYESVNYNINGHTVKVPGHLNTVLTDFTLQFIDKNKNNPFFVTLAHRTPHTPALPPVDYRGIYDTVNIEDAVIGGTDMTNKPNYLYHVCKDTIVPDYIQEKRKYYEVLKSGDDELGRLVDSLAKWNLLDSTLIMVISDNGFFFGEHGTFGKRLAYEESMRIPIILRYPKRIPAGTVIDDNFALNVDIPQTILDAVGSPHQTQGLSLFDIIDGTAKRKSFLYQYENDSAALYYNAYPSFRSIRTMTHKYIRSSCIQATEEMYDMINDPFETHNLAFDQAYTSVMNDLRFKMDSLKIAIGDTIVIDTANCFINTQNQCCLNPAGFNDKGVNEKTQVISWNNAHDINKSIIRFKKITDTDWTTATASNYPIQLQNLKSGTKYLCQAMATCGTVEHESSWSGIDTFESLPHCKSPKKYRPEFLDTATVRFSWDPVPGVFSYTMKIYNFSGNYSKQYTLDPDIRSLVLDNIPQSDVIFWQMETYCDSGSTYKSLINLIDTFSTYPGTYQPPSGISSINNEQNLISLYPNPNDGSFYLSLPKPNLNKLSISIHNLIGEQVYSNYFEQFHQQQKIYFNPENAGIYIVKVEWPDGEALLKCVIHK